MACLSPSQHLFNSFIVDFDDLDPDGHSSNNNKKSIKSTVQHDSSIPHDIKNNHSGDPDPNARTNRSRGVHGMTLSPSLVLPHTSLSSPSDSASPLSPPNSDSSASSNASPAVPLLSLDNAPQASSPSPASHTSPSSTPPVVFVKSEHAPDGILTESEMEHAPGQLPMGPDRLPPDFSRNLSAGKGGCWTCRIRRKKCDEIRVGESCSTCIRLNIDCLGWGPKRPAWMRDKQAVEQYKAGIKDKLIKEGKVRGQPRPQPNQHTGTMSTPQRSMSGPSMTRGGGSPLGYPAAGPSFVASGPVTTTSAQAQHAHGQRYGPYPSPNAYGHPQLHPNIQAQLQQQQQHQHQQATQVYSSSPSTPSSTLSTLGGGLDYFAFESQQLPGHQGPMRRATVSVPVSRHLHLQHHQQVQEQRRRAYQGHPSALHLQHQPAGGSPHGQSQGPLHSFGGPSNEQSFGSLDFAGSMFGGMGGSVSIAGGSMSSVSNSSTLNVPTMNMSTHYTSSDLTNSPMMLPTDDAAFSGGYVAVPQQQHLHYANRPSRSGSGSTSSSTPSSGSHLQLASGIPHSGPTVAASSFSDALMDQSLVEPHLRYHFENVLPMQYVFGSEKAHGILQSLIARDPFGPLTNSLCAMAALHNKKVRVAQGLDQPDNTTANQFFDRAYWQLVNTGARASSMHSTSAGVSQANAGYSEADALAAIHLAGFFLLKDGSGDWSAHLDTAREWLLQTGLCEEGNHNPKATLATMSDAEQLAVKMVIWYDILAAISLHQSPRFMDLCRRLLRRGSNGSSTSEPNTALHMDHIMGCPDVVLLILAETADLAQWKRQERQLGILSVKELVRKGEAIETMLNEYITPASAMQIQHMRPSRPSGEHNAPPLAALVQTERMNVVIPLTGTTGASGSASASSRPVSKHATPAHQSIPLPTESSSALTADPSIPSSASSALLEMSIPSVSSVPSSSTTSYTGSDLPRSLTGNVPEGNNQPITAHLVSAIFRETASLYLHSVINDPSPGVPEVKHSMNRLFATLQSLPSTVDRALILPLALAGCLTNDETQAQYIRSRLSAQDESFGNLRATRLLIERVWQAREQSGVVDWRDVMRDQLGIELLLV